MARTPREVREVAEAIRSMSRTVLDLHGAHVRYGEVVALDPLRVAIEGIEGSIEEADGDLVIGDTVRMRDAQVPLADGDTLALVLMGDGDWVAFEVISPSEDVLDQPADIRYIGGTGNPDFQNGWAHYDTDRKVGFYKHAGRTYLAGMAKDGTSGSTMFTLPASYRPIPDGVLAFAVGASGDLARIRVDGSSGNVEAVNEGNSAVGTSVWLEGVSFRHA